MAKRKQTIFGYNSREATIVILMAILFLSPFGLVWWTARGEEMGDTAFTDSSEYDTVGGGSIWLKMCPFEENCSTTVTVDTIGCEYTNTEQYHYYELVIQFDDFTGEYLRDNSLDGVKWEVDFSNYGIELSEIEHSQLRRSDYPDYYDAINRYVFDWTQPNASVHVYMGAYDFTKLDLVNWPITTNLSLYLKLTSVGAEKLGTYGGPINFRYWFYGAEESSTGLSSSTILGMEILGLGTIGIFVSLVGSEKLTIADIRRVLGGGR